jgi:lipopolysaccharide transport system permease protein
MKTLETSGATQNYIKKNSAKIPSEIQCIEPSRGWASLGLHEIWKYRELLYFLTWREMQGTYRQTALGMASWVFLRPILNVLVLSVVFGRVVKVPTDGAPYPLFSLSALLPWSFFSNAVQRSARSLVDNMHIISKVYFPRMVMPIAGTSSGLADFAASFLVFLVLLLTYRMSLRWEMLTIPLFLLAAFLFSLAAGLWLATLSVRYRDVAFAVTFLLQAFMYISPVVYPVSMVPKSLLWLYRLNPMTGVIEGFRWALLGSTPPPTSWMLISVGMIFALLISGAFIFRRTERIAVDLL